MSSLTTTEVDDPFTPKIQKATENVHETKPKQALKKPLISSKQENKEETNK